MAENTTKEIPSPKTIANLVKDSVNIADVGKAVDALLRKKGLGFTEGLPGSSLEFVAMLCIELTTQKDKATREAKIAAEAQETKAKAVKDLAEKEAEIAKLESFKVGYVELEKKVKLLEEQIRELNKVATLEENVAQLSAENEQLRTQLHVQDEEPDVSDWPPNVKREIDELEEKVKVKKRIEAIDKKNEELLTSGCVLSESKYRGIVVERFKRVMQSALSAGIDIDDIKSYFMAQGWGIDMGSHIREIPIECEMLALIESIENRQPDGLYISIPDQYWSHSTTHIQGNQGVPI
ncbi:MAG: hypothetical protein LBJ43_06640 [Propionibacteriaceae bacterium]|nr:hypothetical protein [Propionibacteriaceae bacterium]